MRAPASCLVIVLAVTFLAVTRASAAPISDVIVLAPERTPSIETTQLYAQIRPALLKQVVEFYDAKALDVLSR
jgi:hypothetical protein